MTEIKWDELLQLAKEKGIDAFQLRWMLDIVKPESDDRIDKAIEWCELKIKEADDNRVSSGQEFVSEKLKSNCFYEVKQYLTTLK